MKKYLLLLLLVASGCDRSYQYRVCELNTDRSAWICTKPETRTGGQWDKPTPTKVECIQVGGFDWRCQMPYNLPGDLEPGGVYLFE